MSEQEIGMSSEELRNGYIDRTEQLAKDTDLSSDLIIALDARDEKLMKEAQRYDKAEKIAESDLITMENENGNEVMKGGINGDIVEIEYSYKRGSGRDRSGSVEPHIIHGFKNGEPIEEQESIDLIKKYRKISDERTDGIEEEIKEKKLAEVRANYDKVA